MIKQVYKGQELTRTKVKNNILKIWDMTDEDERRDWYLEAYVWANSLSLETGKPLSIVVGVIAALSPRKRWSENLIIAKNMIETGDCGHIKLFKDKAKLIIECDGTDEAILDILNGNKISAFYLNIRYPHKANITTIDRHALSIALNTWISEEDYQGMTTKQYQFFVQCYALAAMKEGISPLLMQSATWLKWRKIKKDYR